MQETKHTSMKYSRHVGEKFHADRSVRYFPGNTIICPLDKEHPAYLAALWAQEQLKVAESADKFAFLPPSSFHMTIMGLLVEELREPDYWSKHLPLDCSLKDSDAFLVEQFDQLNHPESIKMRYTAIHVDGHPSIRLEPVDDAMNKVLRDYRNEIAERLGIREPDHDSYGFHISLCYPIVQLSGQEQQRLDVLLERLHEHLEAELSPFYLGAAKFSLFDSMFEFISYGESHSLKSRA